MHEITEYICCEIEDYLENIVEYDALPELLEKVIEIDNLIPYLSKYLSNCWVPLPFHSNEANGEWLPTAIDHYEDLHKTPRYADASGME
jgi:hypothetical protein